MTGKVVHCKGDKFDVYIGRPSKWGNPFHIGEHGSRERVLVLYYEWIMDDLRGTLRMEARRDLRGKILGCWCAPKACHGDILAAIANDGDLRQPSPAVERPAPTKEPR